MSTTKLRRAKALQTKLDQVPDVIRERNLLLVELNADGGMTQASLARELGLSEDAVQKAIREQREREGLGPMRPGRRPRKVAR